MTAETEPPPKPELEIAEALDEVHFVPVREIRGVIAALGLETTWQLAREAQAIHAGTGMLVADGSRKRTLGGCFFELARRALSPADRWRIFELPRQRQLEKRQQRKAKRSERTLSPAAESAGASPPTTEPAAPAQWIAELRHVPTGRSSDASAPRILQVARPFLETYSSEREALEAGRKALTTALEKLYGSRLKGIVPPRIDVRAARQ
ncbi:MAG: hypothetical protein JW940_27115 [Polyangiaceae bacterium]|nr:hypothetical protein [Polyangiaceae bacterium]